MVLLYVPLYCTVILEHSFQICFLRTGSSVWKYRYITVNSGKNNFYYPGNNKNEDSAAYAKGVQYLFTFRVKSEALCWKSLNM